MTADFFYWDETTSSWKAIIGSTYENNPFKTLDTTTGQIVLATKDDNGHSLRPYTNFRIRVEYTANDVKDYYSERMIADEFNVIFKEDCSDNFITITGHIDDSEYYVGHYEETGTDTEYQISYTTSVPSDACPITAKLYIKDPDDGTWIEYNSALPYHAPVKTTSFKATNTGSNYDAGYFILFADETDKANYKPWTNYTFKVELTDDAATDPVAITVSDEFNVHIYDRCWRNQLTQPTGWAEDILYVIQADGSTPQTPIPDIEFSSTYTETVCPLTRTIEIFNETTNQWLEYDSTNTTLNTIYDFFDKDTYSVLSSSTEIIQIQTERYDLFDDETMEPSVFQLRLTLSDPDSGTDENQLLDNFDLTIMYECDDDILSLSGPTAANDWGYQEYQIDSGDKLFAANIAQSVSLCTIEAVHEVWDSTLQSWVPLVKTDYDWLKADPADGAFTVNQAWDAAYSPYQDFTVRITYTSKYSQQSDVERTKTDQYVIRIGDVCKYDTLTKNNEFADWTFVVDSNSIAVSKIPDYTQDPTKVGTCPLTAKIYLFNEVTNVWQDYST